MSKQKLDKLNKWLLVITIVLMLMNIAEILLLQNYDYKTAIFRLFQYFAMVFVINLPRFLKDRFNMEIPVSLSIVVALFAFEAFVLGDGLDFYGKYTWWDSFLHFHSGIILSFIALWIIHYLLKEKDKYIYLNKLFVSLFIVSFSLALGAGWEICEFTCDEIFKTNTQQYMQSTRSSLYSKKDVPLVGHAALNDTIKDLSLDLGGALIVAIYGYIKHDDLIERYRIEDDE